MSIFTTVPGLYRTREGKHVWVKYVLDGTGYPVVGFKVGFDTDKTPIINTIVGYAYTIDGHCLEGKDQAEDIVAFESQLWAGPWFQPLSMLPTKETQALIRWKSRDGRNQYMLAKYRDSIWIDMDEGLPVTLDADFMRWNPEWTELRA
jgi:hypothetical protein